MKTLYIIRHAKSSWSDATMSDFDRPLNERGKKDAPAMAEKLLDRKIKIDAFISSPAKRAKKTCLAFSKVYEADKDDIFLVDELYNAAVNSFYEIISGLDDKLKRVAVFSHNPGITDFVNSLIPSVEMDNMPTCAVFAVEINIAHWTDFKTATKQFLFFDFPKHS
ncbi:MAG: histidine phosphatase family protein [Ferruginibacter sp.]